MQLVQRRQRCPLCRGTIQAVHIDEDLSKGEATADVVVIMQPTEP
jgi:hypothetical protein